MSESFKKSVDYLRRDEQKWAIEKMAEAAVVSPAAKSNCYDWNTSDYDRKHIGQLTQLL